MVWVLLFKVHNISWGFAPRRGNWTREWRLNMLYLFFSTELHSWGGAVAVRLQFDQLVMRLMRLFCRSCTMHTHQRLGKVSYFTRNSTRIIERSCAWPSSHHFRSAWQFQASPGRRLARFQCGHVHSNPNARTLNDLTVDTEVCLSAEPEESLLIQKSQETSTVPKKGKREVVPKKGKGEQIPAFFATMGLEMAELTLKTACTNVEKATLYAQSHLPESPAPAELNDKLGQVFKVMVAELQKGVQEVTAGLQVQGLTTSLVKLKDSFHIAETNIHTMEGKCTFEEDEIEMEISSCKEAASAAHAAMLATFREWIKEAATELLTKVVPWDQGKMKKFNAKKIPEMLDDSA
eukprot:s613_g11.t1